MLHESDTTVENRHKLQVHFFHIHSAQVWDLTAQADTPNKGVNSTDWAIGIHCKKGNECDTLQGERETLNISEKSVSEWEKLQGDTAVFVTLFDTPEKYSGTWKVVKSFFEQSITNNPRLFHNTIWQTSNSNALVKRMVKLEIIKWNHA